MWIELPYQPCFRHLLTLLSDACSGDINDPVVLAVFKEIVDTLKWEKENRTMTPVEIVKNPIARKRLLIGMSAGPFSCIAGNIIASYYLGAELDTAGITDYVAQLKANVVLNVWCLFTSLAGTHLCYKWGMLLEPRCSSTHE